MFLRILEAIILLLRYVTLTVPYNYLSLILKEKKDPTSTEKN